ncbi:unnamed protein product, partial [Brassica rapa]
FYIYSLTFNTFLILQGAVLACAVPWIKCLLLTHCSGIMSQESSLLALNSMYQFIESRVSTLHTAVEVSTCFDLIVDDLDEEEEEDGGPVIYEDKDSDEEEGEGTELAMETDEEADESADGVNDFEDMSD